MEEAMLEEWSIVAGENDPYLAPELWTTALRGKVFGHPSLEDGTVVKTSTLKMFVPEENLAKTVNTTYHLGKMEEGFGEWLVEKGYTIEQYRKL